MSFKIVSIRSPYCIESSSSNTNSGVTLKFIFSAILLLIKPEDVFNPANVCLTFLEFKMLYPINYRLSKLNLITP